MRTLTVGTTARQAHRLSQEMSGYLEPINTALNRLIINLNLGWRAKSCNSEHVYVQQVKGPGKGIFHFFGTEDDLHFHHLAVYYTFLLMGKTEDELKEWQVNLDERMKADYFNEGVVALGTACLQKSKPLGTAVLTMMLYTCCEFAHEAYRTAFAEQIQSMSLMDLRWRFEKIAFEKLTFDEAMAA